MSTTDEIQQIEIPSKTFQQDPLWITKYLNGVSISSRCEKLTKTLAKQRKRGLLFGGTRLSFTESLRWDDNGPTTYVTYVKDMRCTYFVRNYLFARRVPRPVYSALAEQWAANSLRGPLNFGLRSGSHPKK